ncbi:MAG: GNAT family N-acetyltransferase [Bacteroidales bacterium]|nr:GNAT family N-acetyltransferase [Bacteroidales bacterium]MBN2758752.1 GNAT family N-acetyltransferase [Bacteroidales bacterium]
MKQYIVRDYKTEDYNRLMEVWQQTNLSTPGRGDNEITIENTLKLGGKLLLLEDLSNNKIIGTSWMTTDGRRLYLHHFGILPQYQGKGLSKLLLSESNKFAIKLGQQFKLEVHKDNHIAKKLYINYGFKYLGDYEVFIVRNLNELKH